MARYWRAYVTDTEAHGSWIYFSTEKNFRLVEVVEDLLEDQFHLKTIHRYCERITPITYICAICAYPITTLESFTYHRRSVVIR